MTQLLAAKYQAAQETIRTLANSSGYGQFITDAMIQEWSAKVVSAISDAEAKYPADVEALAKLQMDEASTDKPKAEAKADANAEVAQAETNQVRTMNAPDPKAAEIGDLEAKLAALKGDPNA